MNIPMGRCEDHGEFPMPAPETPCPGCEDGNERPDYEPLSDEQIHQIALGISQNSIFHSAMLGDRMVDMLSHVFMPLIFIGDAMRQWMIKNEIAGFYEDYGRAMPRSINGYPMFMSMRMLNDEDNEKVFNRVMEIDKALEALKNGGPSNEGEDQRDPEGS